MLKTLLTASALTLMLAGGAYAQATTGSTNQAEQAEPGPTSPNTADALSPLQEEMRLRWTPFFTDDTMMTFRTEEEIRTGFAGLSPDQQAAIREDCRLVSSGTRSYDPMLIQFCERIDAI